VASTDLRAGSGGGESSMQPVPWGERGLGDDFDGYHLNWAARAELLRRFGRPDEPLSGTSSRQHRS
jgi:hypothetical protein